MKKTSPPLNSNSLSSGSKRWRKKKKGIADDIKDVYGEAKATGFDPKTMKALVRLRKMETAARQEAEQLLETYKAAVGL